MNHLDVAQVNCIALVKHIPTQASQELVKTEAEDIHRENKNAV